MEIKKVSNGIVSGYVVVTEEEQGSPIPDTWQRAIDSMRDLIPPTRGIASAESSFEDYNKTQTSLSNVIERNSRKG